MDIEKFTERARGFIQSAQGLALRSNHQVLTPEHILKVLLDDDEGMASSLIQASGGKAKEARQANELELGKLPKVEGGNAQPYLGPDAARMLEQAETIAKKAGDSFVTAERMLQSIAMQPNTGAGKAL